MSKEAKLTVEPRSGLGRSPCRQLRNAGLVPGVVYGHKEGAVSIAVPEDAITTIVRNKIRVVDIESPAGAEKTIIREVQWDTFGQRIIHFDLMRVDPNEMVHVEIPIELRGTAVGSMSGGILEQPIHHVTVECLAYQIPDVIQLRISNLDVGQALHVSDLPLPEGVKCLQSPDTMVVHVVRLSGDVQAAEAAGSAEPELIGRPAEDSEK